MSPVDKLRFIQETLGVETTGEPDEVTAATFSNLLSEVRSIKASRQAPPSTDPAVRYHE